MTLRSDTLQDIMGDLKLLKCMIKAAKQKHADANPAQSKTQPEKVMCQYTTSRWRGESLGGLAATTTRTSFPAKACVSAELSHNTNSPWCCARALHKGPTMIYTPSFTYRLIECSECGVQFEPLGYGSYEKYCDACYSDMQEQEGIDDEC